LRRVADTVSGGSNFENVTPDDLERVRVAAAFCAEGNLARFRHATPGVAIDVRRSPRPRLPSATNLGDTSRNGYVAAGYDEPPVPVEPPARVLRAEFVGIVRFTRPIAMVGSDLDGDREVAYVEALGIRNPVRSGGAGRVAEVFVADGDAVEYGQALLSLEG